MLKAHLKDTARTQAYWAERFGVSASYLSDLLNGKKMPSLVLAVRIERMTSGAVPASSWIPEVEGPGQAKKGRAA